MQVRSRVGVAQSAWIGGESSGYGGGVTGATSFRGSLTKAAGAVWRCVGFCWTTLGRMLTAIRERWASWIRAAVVVLLALLALCGAASLLVGAWRWWFTRDGDGARNALAPWRYLADHPPSATVVGLIGGVVLLLVFFQPLEKILFNLKEGPFGLKTHEPVEQTRTRNPTKPKDGQADAD